MDTPRPLSAEAVDELLSADLDGEFDAAARDLGLDPADARTQLTRITGVETRRAGLTRAQGALAVLPEIDELMAARLRAKALRAGEQAAQEQRRHRARRWQRVLAVAGAVAATAALVVGVVATTKGTDTNKRSAIAGGAADATSPSSPAAASGALAASNPPIDVGEVPDVQTLAARVSTADAALSAKKQAIAPGSQQPESASTDKTATASTLGGTKRTAGGTQNKDFASAPSQAPTVEVCDATARSFAGVTTGAILRAVATVNGTKVTAEVFRKGAIHVLVVLTLDCRLLNLRTITPAA